MIYNVVLVSGVQQSESVTHTLKKFFFIMGYYRILDIYIELYSRTLSI